MQLQAEEREESPASTGPRPRGGEGFTRAGRETPALTTSPFWTFSIQNCERINLSFPVTLFMGLSHDGPGMLIQRYKPPESSGICSGVTQTLISSPCGVPSHTGANAVAQSHDSSCSLKGRLHLWDMACSVCKRHKPRPFGYATRPSYLSR